MHYIYRRKADNFTAAKNSKQFTLDPGKGRVKLSESVGK